MLMFRRNNCIWYRHSLIGCTVCRLRADWHWLQDSGVFGTLGIPPPPHTRQSIVRMFVFLARQPPSFTRFLYHTQRPTTVGRTPLDEWSARRRDLYLTTHNTQNRHTSMPTVRFEPTTTTSERPQTYPFDRAATGIGTGRIVDQNVRVNLFLNNALYLCIHIRLVSLQQKYD
jgi:hypothetical protein